MQADALSRFAKDHVSDREDNRQVQVLGPKHFLAAAKEHFHPEIDILGDRIRWASIREAEVIEGLKSIDKTAPKALTDGTAMWEEDNGFVYYKGKLYVPNCNGHYNRMPDLGKSVMWWNMWDLARQPILDA